MDLSLQQKYTPKSHETYMGMVILLKQNNVGTETQKQTEPAHQKNTKITKTYIQFILYIF